MKYILNGSCDGIDFGAFEAYLATVKLDLPTNVYAFASNSDHFDLTSKSALHDAWMVSTSIAEIATGACQENRATEITIKLLGAWHDRHIFLRYREVSRYVFDSPRRTTEREGNQTSHGDLMTHEVRLASAGSFEHEILFVDGTTLLIEFSEFAHWEETVVR